MSHKGEDTSRPDRGQLVLVAAGLIAIALVPMLLAYLQLGYAGDIHASEDFDAPVENAERVLERAVHEAGVGLATNYTWGQRQAAAVEARDRLDPRLDTLRSARVEEGIAYQIRYNETAAEAYVLSHCPDGPDRQFGPCLADGGVVLQNRAGEVHLLAVAFDVRAVTPNGEVEVTLVVRAVGGVDQAL